MISTLNKVGITPDSIVLVALDSRPSWRCNFSEEYKANRESLPQEIRDQFNWLKDYLNKNTNWIILEPGQGIEADDLAVYLCKFFKDIPEIVLCSSDHDWEQAWSLHSGVKIFSLHSHKWKIRPENYNLYAEIAKMINKEKSDNLVTAVLDNSDYDKRLMLVDLTRLPEFIEKIMSDYLSNEKLYDKNISYETVPFPSLQVRLDNLYNATDKIIDYDEQIMKEEKKEERKKNKIAKEKLKQKKLNDKIKKLEMLEQKTKEKTDGKVCKSSVSKRHD
jgi:hypothetical protein